MIERICPKCRVPMNGDKCIKPNCGCATKMSSTIYWCDDCNVPIFENICPSCGNKGRYIATDMRPVFPEENVLISLILGDNPQKYQESSVWFGSGMYIIDGKKVRLSITKLNSLPLDKIHKLKEKYEAFVTKINYCFFDEYIRKFIKANADRYNFITEEAVQFVQKYREKYAIEDMMVSFSGGKDSTVTSHIVNRALGTNKVLHIFGDTTLEFPYTLEYKKRFKKNEESRGVRVLTAKNREKNFEDLCDIVGPPSRVMRWCCTVFKTGAIQKTISSAFKDKNNILSFQGIRHSESVSRSKYERESESPKISKQTVASPIIDWIDYDVWLYILTTGIDFNEAYRLGWTRVGCWCCPNNGGWSEFLAKVHMYDQYIHWHELLVNFAKKIGKPDPEEYINDGGWKARQGGNGLEAAQTSVVSFEPCATEEKAFNYELQRPIKKDCRLIVFDEAHKAAAKKTQKVIECLMRMPEGYENRALIGLTATPGRTTEDSYDNNLLTNMFGNKLIYIDSDILNQINMGKLKALNTVAESNIIKYFQERRILAKMEPHKLTYKMEFSESELKILSSTLRDMGYDDKEYTESQLKVLARNKERNLAILACLRQLQIDKKPTIVFACSVDHAKMLAAMLTLEGIPNSLVLGEMDVMDRKRAINIFKNRNSGVDIIINYEVLTTGFDSKNIKCVFITRPTKSIVLYSQMLGRGLRGPLMGGNEECDLIDIDDNLQAFDNETAFSHFNDYWRV